LRRCRLLSSARRVTTIGMPLSGTLTASTNDIWCVTLILALGINQATVSIRFVHIFLDVPRLIWGVVFT
jgi:hypothetical protein